MNDPKTTKTIEKTEKKNEEVKNLDELLEILDGDALRNVTGGRDREDVGGSAY